MAEALVLRPVNTDAMRRLGPLVGAIVLAACLGAALPSAPAFAKKHPPVLAIRGGTLIDGNGGPPLADATVVVQEGRISAVGASKDVSIPRGAKIVDARGKYLVPGLIDAKSNYASNYGEAYLIWGVTTAIVSGGSGDAGIAERDAIAQGKFAGPRLLLSFAGIAGAGPDGKKPSTGVPGRYPYIARSASEAARISRDFLSAGADFLSSADGDGPPEVFAQVVKEAQAAGVPAAMRAMGPGSTARDTAAAGETVLIHSGNVGRDIAKNPDKWKNYIALAPDPYADMDDAKAAEMIRFLIDRKTVLEPDLGASDRGFPSTWKRVQQETADFAADPALPAYFPKVQLRGLVENAKDPSTYLTAEQIDLRTRGFNNHMRFLKMFVAEGGRIIAASDVPQTAPGLGLHQELAVFEEDVGMTPMQVIQSATKWTADAFKLRDLGVIAPGKLADIVIVRDDPTRTAMNLRKIDTVIKAGEFIERKYHPDYLSKTFRVGLYRSGSCCFSSPVVEQLGWVAALKQATWNPNARNGGYGGLGSLDGELNGTPAIESIFPYTVPQGSPAMTFTVRGFNFARGSQLLIDGKSIPVRVISRTELQADLDSAVFARAGKFTVQIRNPQPIVTSDWGDSSNVANLLVPYAFTTKYSRNRF